MKKLFRRKGDGSVQQSFIDMEEFSWRILLKSKLPLQIVRPDY